MPAVAGYRAFLLAASAVAASGVYARAAQPIWRNLGPAVAGGRVAAVAGSDREPYSYYIGAAGGGVFKTTNGGVTWTDVWPHSSIGAVGAIAVSPSNARVVWVGTGEAAPRNDASYGDGIWLSRDGGRHWQNRGLRDSYAIAGIAIDPRNPNAVVVGVLGDPFRNTRARGIYRTRDGGKAWQHTLYVGPQSGICDLARDPNHPNVMYAGVWQFRREPWTFTSGGSQDGMYKSIDGGATWKPLRGSGLPRGTVGRIGVAVAPSDSRRVYALIQSREGLLWRSDDAGAHWRMMSRDTLIDQRPFYMSRLAVDPRNRDHVFFASENLVQTFDGGRKFYDIPQAVHQDHHGFWISHDGKRIIEANDGGAPISVDGGLTWDWRYNVAIAQIYHIGYDTQTPYHVCGAMQDNDSFCGPSLSLSPLGLLNADWRDVANDADGVWVWPEPGNPRAIWNVGINQLNGQLGIYDLDSRQNHDISPDVTDTNGRALAGLPYRFNWEAPLAFSAKERGVAYFGGNVVFETRDRGQTWNAISPDLTRNDGTKQQVAGGPINTDVSGAEFYDTILDIAPSPLDANVIWVGTDDGLIQRTIDHGAHWSNVTPRNIAPWGRVASIEASHFDPLRAYAAIDRHLLGDRRSSIIATADGGSSWHFITAGLPSNDVARVVREDPKNADVLFAGNERGVWLSIDRGAHWQSFQLNMPAVSIHDLRIQPQTGDLIAGTHGRALWIFDDLTAIENLAMAQQRNAPVLFAIPPARSWYYWWSGEYPSGDTECCAAAGEFSAPDPPYGATITYYLPHALRAPPTIDVFDKNGKKIRTIRGSNDPGLNRIAWDLAEAPPTPWLNTGKWNRGPSTGPAVVPGSYSIRLNAGGLSEDERVAVLPDPRAPWTQADYEARHTFLKSLDDELSQIDEALNTLDAMHDAAPSVQREVDSIYHAITSGVRNSEDNQLMADRLRERLTILQGTVALSQGPPMAAHKREAAAIAREFERAMLAYHDFLGRHTKGSAK